MLEPEHPSRVGRPRLFLRGLTAVLFVMAGANHFYHPATYRRIMPPTFPAPGLLVAVSGVFEILGGIGLLLRPLRRAAGWGLIALLIAVFPANVYMATHPERFSDTHIPRWALWARLPLQGVLIAWVAFVALGRSRNERLPKSAADLRSGG